jgi:hypothetical protein
MTEPVRTLEEAKVEKEMEVRQRAEEEFWSKFKVNDWDIPIARILQLIIRIQRGGQVSQGARDRLQSAEAVHDRLDTLVPQVRSATTIEAVDAIRWIPQG